ncbi:MAG: hypothetical protein NDI77_13830 [Geobacteraceae bacterium]|nr:hypothetical protein [Geobacteraceae bacterium]
MKAKGNFSKLVDESAGKGTMGFFGAVAVFIGAFVVWSAACMGGAIVNLFN